MDVYKIMLIFFVVCMIGLISFMLTTQHQTCDTVEKVCENLGYDGYTCSDKTNYCIKGDIASPLVVYKDTYKLLSTN